MKNNVLLIFLFFSYVQHMHALDKRKPTINTSGDWVVVELDDDEFGDWDKTIIPDRNNTQSRFSPFFSDLLDALDEEPPKKKFIDPLNALFDLIVLPHQDRLRIIRQAMCEDTIGWHSSHHAALTGNKTFFDTTPVANLRKISPNGFNPLHIAITEEGGKETALTILKRIQGQEYELEILTQPSNFHALAPLHLALILGNFVLIQKMVSRLFFLANGHSKKAIPALAVFSQPGAGKITPLHIACMLNAKLYIALLLAASASPHDITILGYTPADYLAHGPLREELESYAEAGGWGTYMFRRPYLITNMYAKSVITIGRLKSIRYNLRLHCCGNLAYRQSPPFLVCSLCKAIIPLETLMLLNDPVHFEGLCQLNLRLKLE